MTAPHTPPPESPPERDEDPFLTRGGPIAGVAIVVVFALGALLGQVKDLPPGLLGGVTVLIGMRLVGKVRRP